MSNEEKKIVTENQMENAAGGAQLPFDPGNSYGVKCPKCGSTNIVLSYEHDEVGVFDCRYCGKHFTKNYSD